MVSGLGRQLLDALLDPAEGFLLPQDLAQFYGAARGGGFAGDRHPDGPHDSPVFQPLFLGQVDEGVVHGIVDQSVIPSNTGTTSWRASREFSGLVFIFLWVYRSLE